MEKKDLEVFNQMPFLFWVKDGDGTYQFANKVINDFADEDVTGKNDQELVWSDDADALIEVDRDVLKTGKPHFIHELVAKSHEGEQRSTFANGPASSKAKRAPSAFPL